MSIKLITLIGGERVMCDFYETRLKQQPSVTVGYIMIEPQLVSMSRSIPSQMVDQSNEPEFRVVFTPWSPFAKFQQFRLNPNVLVNVCDAKEDVVEIYRKEFYTDPSEHDFDQENLDLLYYDDPSIPNEVQQ